MISSFQFSLRFLRISLHYGNREKDLTQRTQRNAEIAEKIKRIPIDSFAAEYPGSLVRAERFPKEGQRQQKAS
jgi:hypothetical protein